METTLNNAQKQSRLYSTFYRNGPSHRDGADVTFGDIVKIFGFRTASVGQWVTKQEQQIAANLFFDALCDLMAILGVPEQVISLNGTLSIAFGKGGQKHSSAHYSATTRTLALAKNAGAGSLSHEWFHAFDHFISTRFLKAATPKDFASTLWLDRHDVVEHPLNGLLESCFQHIFLQPNSDKLSTLFVRSVAADKSLGSYYYALPPEVCARAFEAFIQDHQYKNAFLVQGTKQTAEAQIGLYPQGEQRQLIGEYFSQYFATLGYALDKSSARG
ncbi:CLCA_X family protein [Alteromonas facilis]|uniref:CLCA_X family protein n=1 Tax=Alteromonas facilis TaxID=2048004 RepID=UPI000C28C90F|nr:CLCA_X family protein [Alteromonas facilis]